MRRAAFLFVVGLCFAACVGPFAENIEAHYADAAAARRGGAFERGWVPPIVPEEATAISEVHNIDTNQTWGCFSISRGATGVRALLASQGARRIAGPIPTSGPRGLFGRRDWWPSSMSDPRAEVYELNESSRMRLTVGIDATAGRVCFHRS